MDCPSIELKDVGLYLLGTSTKQIFNHAKLKLYPSHIYHLTGENGSGKSTLFKVIKGSLVPQNGEVICNAKNIFVPKDINDFIKIKVKDYITFLSKDSGYSLEQISSIFGFEYCLDVSYRDLSLGEKQKTALLPLLFNDYDLLLLDEAFKYIDFDSRLKITAFIEEKFSSATIIAIEHSEDNLFHFTDEINIKNKKLVLTSLSVNKEAPESNYADITPDNKTESKNDIKETARNLRFTFSSHPIIYSISMFIIMVFAVLSTLFYPISYDGDYYTPAVTFKTKDGTPISEKVKSDFKDYDKFDFSMEHMETFRECAYNKNYLSFVIDNSLSDTECILEMKTIDNSTPDDEDYINSPKLLNESYDMKYLFSNIIYEHYTTKYTGYWGFFNHPLIKDVKITKSKSIFNSQYLFKVNKYTFNRFMMILQFNGTYAYYSTSYKFSNIEPIYLATDESKVIIPLNSEFNYLELTNLMTSECIKYEEVIPMTEEMLGSYKDINQLRESYILSDGFIKKMIKDDSTLTIRLDKKDDLPKIKRYAKKHNLNLYQNMDNAKNTNSYVRQVIYSLLCTLLTLVILSICFLFKFLKKNKYEFVMTSHMNYRYLLLILTSMASLLISAIFQAIFISPLALIFPLASIFILTALSYKFYRKARKTL